jgi:hypothetical protein
MFPILISVRPAAKYQLYLRYKDGTEGMVDLSHLSGRGVFKIWDEADLFFQVSIDPETNALVWNEMVDLDPDSLYLQIKGVTFEQWKAAKFPLVRSAW